MPEEQNPNDDEYAVPVYRHEARQRDFEIADRSPEDAAALEEHINQHFGPIETVFHEIVSDLVHIDVHFIPPGPGRNYHTLVTTGMSDRPMRTPEGAEAFAYAELMVQLPAHWPLSEEAFRDDRNYWPVLWLKRLARLPHEYETWLFHGHTVPNGDPPQGFAPDTELCCWWLWDPNIPDPEQSSVRLSDDKEVYFLQIVPLYKEEIDVKLRKGNEAFLNLLGESNVPREQFFIIDRKRPNAAAPKRGFWPFGR
jgi:hypothetical protein